MISATDEYADMPCLVMRFSRFLLNSVNRDREVILTPDMPEDAKVVRVLLVGSNILQVRITSEKYRQEFKDDIDGTTNPPILTSEVWEQVKAAWDSLKAKGKTRRL